MHFYVLSMSSRRLKVIGRHLGKSDLKIRLCSSSADSKSTKFTDKEFKYTLNHGPLSVSDKVFYERNGFIIKRGLVEEGILDACSSRFIDLCEGHVPKGSITLMKDISLAKKGAKGQYLYNKAQDIHFDEVFEKYALHEKLLDVVECFTGPNIKSMHTMLINKPPDSGSLSSRHPLHQDLHYFPFRPADLIVAAWTALEDVTIDNGCLIVIPGSHTGQLLQHGYPEWEAVNKAYYGIKYCEEHDVTPVEMKKGDTIFFHPLLIHGSGLNKTKGFRKAISVHYAASECHYIDVKGTTQEQAATEIEAMAIKKMGFPISFQDIWRARSRLVRGEESSL